MASRYDKHSTRDSGAATGGGASAGRGGRKTGGATYTGQELDDQGTLTCDACHGTGAPERRQLEADEDGTFSGSDSQKCAKCDGSGKVKAR